MYYLYLILTLKHMAQAYAFTVTSMETKSKLKRCLTCPFVVSRTTVTGPKSTVDITDHFNCTTPSIIYCSHCNKLYIGEIGRRLGDHIRDHLYEIRKNNLSKPVSRHFNCSNHSISILLHLVFLSSMAVTTVAS